MSDLQKVSINQPVTSGLYRFSGIRYSPSGREIVHVHDLVQVRRVIVGHKSELVVAFFGNARLYPVRDFEGEWEKVNT
jgi:hypothetical protein